MNEQDEARRQQDLVIRAVLSQIKKKYLVMSGKGGVGKSSVAVNLAAALASGGARVGLLDIDLHGPSIPHMLGLAGRIEVGADRSIRPQAVGPNLFVVSIESMLADKDDAVIWRGPKKLNAIRQFISDVSWGELDYLFIDSPPGTGDEPLAAARHIPGAKAVVVTTPQEISLADVRKSIRFLKKVGLEIAGVVENMSGFICPHCGETTDLFGRGGGKLLAETLNLVFLGSIPLEPEVVSLADQGRLYLFEKPNSEFALAVQKIAAQL
ncbi:MAG: Mrp/NBP35 family ATP-binding protein [Pseudomonadota bacterium]